MNIAAIAYFQRTRGFAVDETERKWSNLARCLEALFVIRAMVFCFIAFIFIKDFQELICNTISQEQAIQHTILLGRSLALHGLLHLLNYWLKLIETKEFFRHPAIEKVLRIFFTILAVIILGFILSNFYNPIYYPGVGNPVDYVTYHPGTLDSYPRKNWQDWTFVVYSTVFHKTVYFCATQVLLRQFGELLLHKIWARVDGRREVAAEAGIVADEEMCLLEKGRVRGDRKGGEEAGLSVEMGEKDDEWESDDE